MNKFELKKGTYTLTFGKTDKTSEVIGIMSQRDSLNNQTNSLENLFKDSENILKVTKEGQINSSKDGLAYSLALNPEGSVYQLEVMEDGHDVIAYEYTIDEISFQVQDASGATVAAQAADQ